MDFMRMETPLLIAHRGGAGLYPENTIFSFKQALLEYSADAIELDIRQTSDGEIVVIHDSTVDRTTNGSGLVRDMTLTDIKGLDAGWNYTNDSGKTHPYRGCGIRIPTLREVLDEFNSTPLGINIEIKQGTPSIEARLYNMITHRGMTKQVLVNAGHPCIMKRFRSINIAGIYTGADFLECLKAYSLEKLGLGTLYSPRDDAMQIPVVFHGLKVVSEGLVNFIRDKSMQSHIWTINDAQQMRGLLDLGVGGIVTDYPDRLRNVLGNKDKM